jgi:hypothetical protein
MVPAAPKPTPARAEPCMATWRESHHWAVVPIERAVEETRKIGGAM